MIFKILEKLPSSLIKTDFLRMKERTVFKRIEIVGTIAIVVLILFRFLIGTSLNGALLVALVFQTIYYMWFGFFLFSRVSLRDLATPKSRNQVSPFMVISSIIMGLIYSVATIAMVYGLFFYQGMNVVLSGAVLLIILSSGITLLYHWLNVADRPLLKQYYKRSFILGAFCLALWLTPVDTRLEILFKDYPEFVEAYKNLRDNPDNEEAKQRLREARSYFR